MQNLSLLIYVQVRDKKIENKLVSISLKAKKAMVDLRLYTNS